MIGMRSESDKSKVVDFQPSVSELCATIHELAQDSDNVSWTNHAIERMDERGITTLDALRVLRIGMIEGPIEPGLSPGEWKCKITAPSKGSREIGVVSVVAHRQRIFIKTVEWEDLK